jgi:hypothetical protein
MLSLLSPFPFRRPSFLLPLFLIVVALLCLSLNGCATLTKVGATVGTYITPTTVKMVDTAVDIAVTAEIIKDPALSAVKAKAFKAIAQQVLADTSNPAVSIAQLEDTLNVQLVKLAPNPLIAASIISLVGGLQGALNNAISAQTSNAVTQATLVDIAGIATEVIRVTSFYGA